MNRKTVLIAVLVIALVATGIWTRGFGLLGNGEDGELTLYGNVDIREVDMAFRVGGRISAIAVEEGDTVSEGQELAVIDAAPLDARIAEADAGIAAAEAQLAKLRNGSRSEDIAQARARLNAVETSLKEAEADVTRREPLVGPGAISRDAWQATVAQRDRLRSQAEEARQALGELRTGARKEDIAAAEAQVRSARATRETINTDRNDTRLVAATAGTVITRAEEPGAIVQPGQTVLTLSIDRPLRVRAYVAETDLSRISTGTKVTVSADGNDKTYHGTIGFISPQAEFTPKTVQTEDLRTDLVYRLRIVVDDPDNGLRQGQPVTVTIPDAAGQE